MPSEADLLRAQINQYDTLIANRRQAQQQATAPPHHHHPYNHTNYYGRTQTVPSFAGNQSTDAVQDQPYANNRWATRGGYYRGRGRGAGGPPVHRNRSLVLNTATNPQTSAPSAPNPNPSADGEATPSQPWIQRSDRHLQLINPAIYEKESQTRAKAIEETRRLKLKQKDEREKVRLAKHLQRWGSIPSTMQPFQTAQHEITVQDVKFLVIKDGSKLLKIRDAANAAKPTPKKALIGGVLFHRSKTGNMYRATVVKAQGRRPKKQIQEQCRIFSQTGVCGKGSYCRYMHDPSKVSICMDYLMRGECFLEEGCNFSHELTPERTPMCLHFQKGRCSNANCRYTHVHVAPGAPVCRAFAVYGYCEKGAKCPERHVKECPDFSNTGSCKVKGCKLPHKIQASTIRKKTGSEDSSDLSSDDDDEIDSDDVDSDDMTEEFFGGDEAPSENDSIARQDDFVHL